MLPIAVQEQLDGQPHVSAALLQEVVAGVALGENIFQLLRVGNRPLDMDFIQLQVKLGSLNNYLTDWQELKARLILVICSWILTSTDGASQPLCLLWTRLLNRGWR